MEKDTLITRLGKSISSAYVLTFIVITGLALVAGPNVLYAQDTTPPTPPSSLTGLASSVTQIDLSRIASTDEIGVTGYQVQRCQGASCSSFALVATVTTGTAYSDPGLRAETTYRYRVRATDTAGNLSTFSNIGSATAIGAHEFERWLSVETHCSLSYAFSHRKRVPIRNSVKREGFSYVVS